MNRYSFILAFWIAITFAYPWVVVGDPVVQVCMCLFLILYVMSETLPDLKWLELREQKELFYRLSYFALTVGVIYAVLTNV